MNSPILIVYRGFKENPPKRGKKLKILTLYCEGAEREEIAEILQISSGTLKNHISSILKKTDFPNMPKLSIYCVANDYIVPNLKE